MTSICPGCSKEFTQKRPNRIIRHCSTKCAGVTRMAKRAILSCDKCGKSFARLISRLPHRKKNYCTDKCARDAYKENPPSRKQGFWYENGYKVISVNGLPIKEHISVMHGIIGRKLYPFEIVHHKNHKRDDNRPENLQLMTRAEHTALHRAEAK